MRSGSRPRLSQKRRHLARLNVASCRREVRAPEAQAGMIAVREVVVGVRAMLHVVSSHKS